MELRWFSRCDEYGRKSESQLQYREDFGKWETVKYVERKVIKDKED